MKRWIDLWLCLYPRRFRRRHGADLRRLYLERAGTGPASFVRVLLAVALDTLHDAPGAHVDEWRRRRATRGRDRLVPTGPEWRQTVRSLVRRPTFSLIIIATLALGIGANTAIFSLVRGVLLAPLPYADADRLVRLMGTRNGEVSTGGTLAYLDIVDMAERSRAFTGIAAYDEWTTNLTGDGEPMRLDAALVSAGYFDLLGVAPALGRFFRPEEDIDGQDRVVVLEYGFWQSRFGGDRDVVGRTVTLNGNPHIVVGVASVDFEDPDLSDEGRAPQLWRPLGLLGVEADSLPNRGSSSYVAIGRLAPGVPASAAQSELGAIAADLSREHPTSNFGRGVALIPIREQLLGNIDESLFLLLAAVGFLLVIAVTNVTSMMLGRAAERVGESALRRALGAGRLALVRGGMLEGAVLALLGGAAGVWLAHFLIRVVVGLAGTSLPRAGRVVVDGQVLLFAFLLSAAVSLACGVLPALRSAAAGRFQFDSRGSRSATDGGVLRLRGGLVVVQIALALVLLHGATLLVHSLLRLQHIEVGVESSGLVTFDLALPFSRYPEPAQRNAFYGEVLDRLATLPGAVAASSTNILPLSGNFDGNSVLIPGHPSSEPEGEWSAQTRSVSSGFFEAAGVPILRGRSISKADRPEGPPVAVINQVFAEQFWSSGDAIGSHIRMMDQEIEIVGIVGDTKHLDLVEAPIRHIYLAREQAVMSWQGLRQSILVRVEGDSLAADRGLVDSIRQAVWQTDPEIPVANLRSMQQVIDATVRHPRLRATLVAAFAGVALLLGAVGIYGVSSYGIALEQRALAIRMALGADGGDIARHVLGRVTAWAVAGSVLGLAGAWVLGRVIERFLYGTGSQPQELLALVALLVVVALAAGWMPARRAAGMDPVSSLKAN